MLSAIKTNPQLMQLLQSPDLYLGIRHDYCNIYYRCASMGKLYLATDRSSGFKLKTHQKYLEGVVRAGSSDGYFEFSEENLDVFLSNETIIRANIDKVRSTQKEKIAQQHLVMTNNTNLSAEWFCVDLEYIQRRDDNSEDLYGRFDIVAVRKQPGNDGKHDVAIIELKVDKSAYSTSLSQSDKALLKKGLDIDSFNGTLGSGILGHIADFYRFETRTQKSTGQPIDRYAVLKEEIVTSLANRAEIFGTGTSRHSVPSSIATLQSNDLSIQPKFYFLTLCCEETMEACIISMKKYLHAKQGCKGASEYNVMDAFGNALLKKGRSFSNYKFLFAECKLGAQNNSISPNIDDILSTQYFTEFGWNDFTT